MADKAVPKRGTPQFPDLSDAARDAGMTPADVSMFNSLAAQVLNDRLNRAGIVGTTKKGRVIMEFRGEPTAAEKHWAENVMQPPKRRGENGWE